ncbi:MULTISPECIES: hypothetical protein [unclassified Corynebacterium]|nr:MULTISPECIES: hypothetical protein [unclassified Corynebacterium]
MLLIPTWPVSRPGRDLPRTACGAVPGEPKVLPAVSGAARKE